VKARPRIKAQRDILQVACGNGAGHKQQLSSMVSNKMLLQSGHSI
jgi:Holliday junction resolvasome RuvABC endonuclease subunit